MNTDELQSIQAPLKERYREQLDAALITIRAHGRIGEQLFTLLRLTERYCGVYQALAHPSSMEIGHSVVPRGSNRGRDVFLGIRK